MRIQGSDALIVVDVQNDFCAGGSLEVRDGDAVVPVINRLMPLFGHVLGTLDWHPPDHSSFTDHGGTWPVHCVQGSTGAETHPNLDAGRIQHFAKAGTNVDIDGYSGFVDTDLEEQLRSRGVRRVFVTGLATDYCVKHTALDALGVGFETVVVTDACRAVNVAPGDGDAALEEMRAAGATLVSSGEINS